MDSIEEKFKIFIDIFKKICYNSNILYTYF